MRDKARWVRRAAVRASDRRCDGTALQSRGRQHQVFQLPNYRSDTRLLKYTTAIFRTVYAHTRPARTIQD